jgi:photosystem II stability/assembly factor-like uncharacterized protein
MFTPPALHLFIAIAITLSSCTGDNPAGPAEDEPVSAAWFVQNPYPQGLDLRDVSVADEMTVTAVGDYGTIIRTVDGGETWTMQESGIEDALLGVSFATPDIGTVISPWAVLRTIDGGETWTRQMSITDPLSTDYYIDVCFTHPDTGIVAAHNGKVFLTTDGGSSWIERKATDAHIDGVSFCDGRNGMFVGSKGALWTDDGGFTWEKCELPSYPFPVSCSMFDPRNAYVVGVGYGMPGSRIVELFKTMDGGETWQSMTSGTSQGEYVTQLDEQIVVAAGSQGVINRSENGGVTWEPRDSGTDENLYAISFSGRDLGMTVGAGGEIVRSLDGGDTWGSVSRGCRMDLFGVFFTDPFRGTAVGRSGVMLRTSDGGETWVELTAGTANPDERSLYAVEFTDDDNGLAVGTYGLVITTADGGLTWTQRASSENSDLSLFGLAMTDNNIGTAVGAYGRIIRTIDGGLTWAEQECPLEWQLHDVDFLDAGRGIAVGTYGAIVRTEDGGETWENASVLQQYTFYGVAVLDEERAVAVGAGGQILRTTDGGDRWFQWPSGVGNDLFSVSFIDGNNGLIVGDNVILSTCDGGETWDRNAMPSRVFLRGSQIIDGEIMTAVGLDGAVIRSDGAAD